MICFGRNNYHLNRPPAISINKQPANSPTRPTPRIQLRLAQSQTPRSPKRAGQTARQRQIRSVGVVVGSASGDSAAEVVGGTREGVAEGCVAVG